MCVFREVRGRKGGGEGIEDEREATDYFISGLSILLCLSVTVLIPLYLH